MSSSPLLSIVTPTRGNFSDRWLASLCAVQGEVEFLLVFPPGEPIKVMADPRFRIIISPFKGEVFQRLLGLLNASGSYVMELDDDDYLHPQILDLIGEYFTLFPDSWCLRPSMRKIDFDEPDIIYRPWDAIPDLASLKVAAKKTDDQPVLQAIAIAPLQNKFDWRFLFSPFLIRKDMKGSHIENFNNKVWKTSLVKTALVDLSHTMRLFNALTWIPRWSLDRMLGLYIQAKFFEPNKTVGHWLPAPEQIRYVKMPSKLKQELRLILPADALLAKRFPQYGYFWNLFFEQFWVGLRTIGSHYNPMNRQR